MHMVQHGWQPRHGRRQGEGKAGLAGAWCAGFNLQFEHSQVGIQIVGVAVLQL